MRKIIFYVKNNLSSHIDLNKIGLIIRPLSKEEYNNLFNGFSKIILDGNDLELAKKYSYFKTGKEEFTNNEKIELFEKISESKKEHIIIDIYNGYNGNAFKVLTSKNIKNELNNFLIAEIDENEFNKHFYENYIYDLLPKLIDFSNYISSDGNFKEYGHCKINEFNNNEINDKIIGGLFLILLAYNDSCSLNERQLRRLEEMFKNKDKDFNFTFIMMIDNILEDNVLVENRIINKVSFLERLLISKEENKTEAFILKVGILCNKLFDIPNEKLSKRLKEIYNIRSMLVHGDGNKIIDNIDYYKNIFSEVITKRKNKIETKLQILWCVDSILDLLLIRVLNRYLDDFNLCEFIKQN